MWLTQLLERNRQCFPDRLAVVDERRGVTWAQLETRTANLAGGLAKLGVRHGDRVAVLSTDRVEVLETYFALGRLGAIFVPLNHGLVPAEVAEVAARSRVTGIIGEDRLLARHAALELAFRLGFDDPQYESLAQLAFDGTPPDVRADDLVAILHTSATTGRPKGVVVDHRSIKAISLGWLAVAGPTEDVVLVNCCPLFHGSMVVSLAYMAAGATIVLMPGFTPQHALKAIERHKATHVWLVPEMLRFLLEHRQADAGDLSGLREIMYGAAPMPPDLYARAAEELRCGFRQVYGMTEVGGPFVTLAPGQHPAVLPGGPPPSVPAGRVIPGMSVRILDEVGEELDTGSIGEVCVRGDGLMRGYWDDPGATAEITVGGWIRTGDLGYLDPAGYIHLVDRRKDLIIRSGQNIYPAEIERVLREHDAVADAAVIGIPDEDYGEVPLAFVVPAAGAGGDARLTRDLFGHVAQALAPYKRPREIRYLESLPRNPAGKILKKVLRDLARPSAGGTES